MADLICSPDYQLVIQKDALPLNEVNNPKSNVDLRLTTYNNYKSGSPAQIPGCM